MTETKKKLILLIGDVLCVIGGTYLSVLVRSGGNMYIFYRYTAATTFFVLSYVLSFYIFDLYNLQVKFKSTAYLTQFLAGLFTATSIIAGTFYFFPAWKIGRAVFIINMGFVGSFAFLWRLLFSFIFAAVRNTKAVAIVGAGWAGKTICDVLKRHPNYEIKCFIDDDVSKWNQSIKGYPIIGPHNRLLEMASNKEIEVAIVAITYEKSTELLNAVMEAKVNGIEIIDMTTFYEELEGKLPVEHLSNGWFIFAPFYGIRKSIYTNHLKRVLDICLAILGLIMALPIICITALAIRLDSAGPILFLQRRVGYNGKVFELLKFRSMAVDAEKNGAVWAQKDDSRVTRVGKMIRKTRIDEIPQIWNVLKGEMSFVGPRPERPEFVQHLQIEIPFYALRHSVKPGISGWAQVLYPYGASEKDALEKLQYDLYYIKNLSAFLDLHIVLKTIRVVLFGRGAR